MISTYWLFLLIPAFIIGVFTGAVIMLSQLRNDFDAADKERARKIKQWLNEKSNSN